MNLNFHSSGIYAEAGSGANCTRSYENLPSSFPEGLHRFRFLPETHGRPRIPGVFALPSPVPRFRGNEVLAPVSLLVLLPAPATSLSPPGPHSPAELGLPCSCRSTDQAASATGPGHQGCRVPRQPCHQGICSGHPSPSHPFGKAPRGQWVRSRAGPPGVLNTRSPLPGM